MNNLFIIGNGFDIAHDIPTEYKKFKKKMCEDINCKIYVDDEKLPVIEEMPPIPIQQIHTIGSKIYNPCAEIKMLFWLIDNAAANCNDMEWKDFESLLGKLDYVKVIEAYQDNENIVSVLTGVLNTLEYCFLKWINTIKISDEIEPKKFLKTLITPENDLVLSFNYTETMEVVYGLREENVCHIHGKRETDEIKRREKGMSCFGENNEKLIVGYDGANYDPYSKFNAYSNILDKLIAIDTRMQKESEMITWRKKSFFDRIRNSDIMNIYSFGFSYSKADEPQIREVCKALNKDSDMTVNMTWYLNSFDNKEGKNEKYKNIIRDYGFKGKFEIYDADK